MTDWSKPKDPGSSLFRVTGAVLPPISEVPEEFADRNGCTEWHKVVRKWFFSGLPEGTQFKAKKGIDKDLALRQVCACLGSWEPKHEHKVAGVAYLLSLFFDDIVIPGGL